MRRFFAMAALGLGVAVVAGCNGWDSPSVSTRDFAQRNPRGMAHAGQLSEGDTIELSVEVDGNMEVSMHRATINPYGVATLPLVGDVRIGGLKVDAARDVIAKAYAAYYVSSPLVMLNSVEDAGDGEWGYVTVTGKVLQPGRVQVKSSRGMNLTEVIQQSGGFAASAKRNDIRVTRTDSGGRRLRVSVNYEDIGLKGDVDADLSLFDGDIVYVPERMF